MLFVWRGRFSMPLLFISSLCNILMHAPFKGYAPMFQSCCVQQEVLHRICMVLKVCIEYPCCTYVLRWVLPSSTDGILTAVQTLASTSLCGIIHSFLGGQPLLILGVAEPTVIMYTFMYNFVKDKSEIGPRLFLAWSGWWVDIYNTCMACAVVIYSLMHMHIDVYSWCMYMCALCRTHTSSYLYVYMICYVALHKRNM